MVPTTFNGIVLLIILLVPGFIYVLRREKHTPSRKFSGFRETLRIIVASAFAYGALAVGVTVGAFLSADIRQVAVALVIDSTEFQKQHALKFAIIVVGAVLVATLVCAFVGGTSALKLVEQLAKRSERLAKKIETWKSDHAPISSAWWTAFELQPLAAKRISITLSEGTVLSGLLYSYSQDADDHPDRDVVLQAPLFIQNPEAESFKPLPGASLIVSAREIRFLTVVYETRDAEGGPR